VWGWEGLGPLAIFPCVNLFLFKQKIACPVEPAGHRPGVRVAPLALGNSLPCVGGWGRARGSPCQAVPGGEPPSLALPTAPRDSWVSGGCGLGGHRAVAVPPSVRRLALPGLGVCRCGGPCPGLRCSSAHPFLPPRYPTTGGAAAVIAHLPAGTTQPPGRDLGGESEGERAKSLPAWSRDRLERLLADASSCSFRNRPGASGINLGPLV